MRLLSSASLFAAACLFGCAPNEIMDPPDEGPSAPVLETPALVSIAPSAFAVGETVQIVGEHFPTEDLGHMSVQLTGDYTDEAGEVHAYDGTVPVVVENAGIASFEFGPVVWFSPTGDRIGTFTGAARLISQAGPIGDDTSEELVSNSSDVSLEVKPSILVDALRSVDAACSATTEGTIGNANIGLGIRAIGMGGATIARPIAFRIGFSAPTVKAQFVRNELHPVWPFNPGTDRYAEAKDGNVTLEHQLQSGTALVIDPQSREMRFRVSPEVQIGPEYVRDITLQRLFAGPLLGPGTANATFYLEAENADGVKTSRFIDWKIFNEAEIQTFNGQERLVERANAESVTACFPGGDIGRDLSYSEGESKTLTRSVSVRWDLNSGQSLGLQAGVQVGTGVASPLSFGVNASVSYNAQWSQTFGTDASESVSSETHSNVNLNAHVIPTFFGQCYRQVERLERTVDVVYHNVCGVSAPIGKATLTDWNFGFDVATGPACPPETNLPPPQLFE